MCLIVPMTGSFGVCIIRWYFVPVRLYFTGQDNKTRNSCSWRETFRVLDEKISNIRKNRLWYKFLSHFYFIFFFSICKQHRLVLVTVEKQRIKPRQETTTEVDQKLSWKMCSACPLYEAALRAAPNLHYAGASLWILWSFPGWLTH